MTQPMRTHGATDRDELAAAKTRQAVTWRTGFWMLVALFVSGAVPYRFETNVDALASIAVLDIVIVVATGALVARLLQGAPLDVGNPRIFLLLAIPLGATCLSLLWSLDWTSTIRAIIIYAESLIAYLVVVNAGSSLSTRRLVQVGYLFALLLIIPGVLMWLRVPGFQPQLLVNADDEAILIGYYARFSHPFIGRSNNLAGLLAFVIFLFAGWAIAKRSRIAAAMAVLAALALIATLSRGVILAVLLALPIMTIASRRAFMQVSAVAIVTVVACWFLVAEVSRMSPMVSEYLQDRMSDKNVAARLSLLDDSIRAIGERPLLGFGAGASAAASATLAEGAHNTYLEQLLYFGVPLGAAVGGSLLLLPSQLRSGRVRIRRGIMERAAAAALYCQLIVFLTQTSFEASILRILFYMLVAYALMLIVREPGPDDHVPSRSASA